MKKRLFGILLSLAMVLTMMPALSQTAYANEEVTQYPLWVGGERVTSENMSGDGWSYTPATTGEGQTPATLTLDGYISNGEEYENSVIYAKEHLTIELKGDNRITGYCGIQTANAKGVTITGEGFLTITGTDHCAIRTDNYLEISSGTVTAEGHRNAFNSPVKTGSDMMIKAGNSEEDAKPVKNYGSQKWAKIGNHVSRNVRFRVVNGAWNDGEKADKTVSLEGFKDETVLTQDKIPAVGSKPDTGYKAGSWDVTPAADTLITEDTTYTYTYAEKDAPAPAPTPEPTPSKKTSKTVVVAKAIASGKTKAKLSWNDAGADRYVIYRGICGKSIRKYKTVNGRTRTLTVSKLRSGEKYRFCVVAQKKSGKSYRTIAKSGEAHMAAGNVSGSYTNVKDLKVNSKAVNLKKGRSFIIKTSLTKVEKNKRLLGPSHDPGVRFTTDDPGVAVVNSKGKITAKGKGSCRIYVQAVNGIWKTVKVTVK